ncbi:MAG: lipopolysaccharide kinase InaA family protein [Bacteroidales bacterium]|nr:lipopolysaccharide kinase InaA family protein [Bacteroidales bacterium]
MPVNLRQWILRDRPVSVAPPTPPGHDSHGGVIVYHPRYRAWLVRCGLTTPATVSTLPGEIVCGHPDRHVVRVELGRGTNRRIAFLKREHVVGVRARVRNRLAGFGPVSRSEREAMILQQLEQAGLPGPQWLAYGEDERGHGFLLVDQVSGADDLRTVLGHPSLTVSDRRQLMESIGRTLAELHRAGFSTPDLAAKHVLVHPETFAVTLLDWQSARPGPIPDLTERVRQLAGLSASLADHLVTPAEQLRCLWSYWRVLKRCDRRDATAKRPRFSAYVRRIAAQVVRLRHRSSSQDQRTSPAAPQRLIWLDGEEVCIVPEMRDLWPRPVSGSPFYRDDVPTAKSGNSEEWLTFADNTRAILQRFQTVAPLARSVAAIRERPWRSPAAKMARILFHLARHNIDGPRLLGFGQRLQSYARAMSFIAYEPLRESQSLFDRLDDLPICSDERRTFLREVGAMLRKLHDSRCRLGAIRPGDTVFLASLARPLQLAVESPSVIRLVKRVRDRGRVTDFVRLCRVVLPGLSRTDYVRMAHGYASYGHDVRQFRKRLLARVI